jgi:serine/threonine protein kinase
LVNKLASRLKSELILLPEASKGDLFEYVQTNGILSERAVRYFITQIVSALSYAHSRAKIHPHLLA